MRNHEAKKRNSQSKSAFSSRSQRHDAKDYAVEPLEARRLLSADIYVSTTADEDGSGQPVDGSLRAAIIAANAAPGSNIILADLSGTISLDADLPAVTQTTVIEVSGNTSGIPTITGNGFNGLTIKAPNCVISDFWITGCNSAIILGANSNNTVVSYTSIGNVDPDNAADASNTSPLQNEFGLVIDSGSSNDVATYDVFSGNTQAGVFIGAGSADAATNNTIEYDKIGLNSSGTAAGGFQLDGVDFSNVSGNVVQYCTLGGNSQSAIASTGSGANTIQGNWLGVGSSGPSPIPNENGLQLGDTGGDYVADNSIQNSSADGIYVTGTDANILNNTISGNTYHGVNLDEISSANTVSGNTFDNNGWSAIYVGQGSNDNSFLKNTFSGNDSALRLSGGAGGSSGDNMVPGNGLSIDLGGISDTPLVNQPNGGLTTDGANGDQPFPTLVAADSSDGQHINVHYQLLGIPNTNYVVDLYADASASPTAYGQGSTFITEVSATANAQGMVSGSAQISKSTYGNDLISATATNNGSIGQTVDAGSTSEFSLQVAPTPYGPTVSVANASAGIGQNLVFPITLSAASSTAITLNYTVVGLSGNIGDLEAPAGTVTIAAGQTTGSISIPVNADSSGGQEQFALLLANPSKNATLPSTTPVATVSPDASQIILTVTPTQATQNNWVRIEAEIIQTSGAISANPTGNVTLTLDGKSLGTASTTNEGQVSFSIQATTDGSHTITADYVGDPQFAASTATATFVVKPAAASLNVSTPPVGASQTLGVQVGYANNTPAPTGRYEVSVYSNENQAFDGSQVLVTTQSFMLHSKNQEQLDLELKHIHLKRPAGKYYLLIQVTDPKGNILQDASSQSVVIPANTTAITLNSFSFVPPAKAGHAYTMQVLVTNTGNEVISGPASLTVGVSNDGTTIAPGLQLASGTKNFKIQPGKTATVKLRFNPHAITAGTYYPAFTLTLDGITQTVIGSSKFTYTQVGHSNLSTGKRPSR